MGATPRTGPSVDPMGRPIDQELAAMQVDTSAKMEGSGSGKEKRSHVIDLVADLFDAGLVPFRIELPRGVVDYELVCAVRTPRSDFSL